MTKRYVFQRLWVITELHYHGNCPTVLSGSDRFCAAHFTTLNFFCWHSTYLACTYLATTGHSWDSLKQPNFTKREVKLETSQETAFHRTLQWDRGGARLLAVFRRAFSHHQRWGLGLAQCIICYSSLTLGLVLYIYRAQLSWRVSLAGCQHAVFL